MRNQVERLLDVFEPEDEKMKMDLEMKEVDVVFEQIVDPVPCACGLVMYCSESCRDTHAEDWHRLFCASSNSLWTFFLSHAEATNEIFILAAQTIGKILMTYLKIQEFYE